MNSTPVTSNDINDFYIVCSLSGIFALIAVVLSGIILILVRRTKPRLHTVRHLLMCNTCIASILYCVVQTNNYVFLIFLPWETSDVNCRWRGYFSYITISAVPYSYLTQAISRFFISVLSSKYRWLTTFKTHYILIFIQWLVVLLITLPAIVTKDIYFRYNELCWIPLKNIIHVIYTYIVYYTIPILSVCMIYVSIYYRLMKAKKSTGTLIRSTGGKKRDLEVLRNILVLLGIYFSGGVPTLLFLLTSNKILYLIGIVTISLSVAIEKVCAVLLDREIRLVVRNLVFRSAQTVPLENTRTSAKHQGNVTRIPATILQPSLNNKHVIPINK
jgi:hypothetical protein